MKKSLIALLVALLAACVSEQPFDLEKTLERRPPGKAMVFDFTGIMATVAESTNRHLEAIRDRWDTEILVAVVPGLENRYTVNEAAVTLFTGWEIGKAHGGKGLLILFVNDEKKVKIEVGKEVEDVFTDAFTGHIQDVQLQPRFVSGELAIGLIAVMEELEARAQVKLDADDTRARIAAMDEAYLSQGAGAGRNLEAYSAAETSHPPRTGRVNTAYPAGSSPGEAWETLLERLKNRVKDPFLGVYTPITRLTYRDYTRLPDARLQKEYDTYAGKPFEVRQAGNAAVIYFGKREGWDNAPFLLSRTEEGWQFDIVRQRRFIRMGKAPHWGVEFSEYPHMALLMDSFLFQGQDIPFDEADRCTIERDRKIAAAIVALEEKAAHTPEDAGTLAALGRLYTLSSMNQKAIPLLEKAARLAPEDPAPHKYLAIAHVDGFYQYEAALTHLKRWVEMAPTDPFGHLFSGYILYRTKAYASAAKAFERALALEPESAYAHFYLTYTFAWLHSDASDLNPLKNGYLRRFHLHREKALAFETSHPLRVQRLRQWLDR